MIAGMLAAAAFVTTQLAFVARGDAPRKPMDLVWTGKDANSLPLNPDWYGQSGRSHADGSDIDASAACDYFHNNGGTLHVGGCTSQHPQVDQRVPLRGALPDLVAYACNFYAGPREARSGLGSRPRQLDGGDLLGGGELRRLPRPAICRSTISPLDGDLDFTLTRRDHASSVKGNDELEDPGITLEANRRELGDLNTPWWSRFRDSIESNPKDSAARDSLHAARAVAIGLLGIDTKHGAHTELHPLYALLARSAKNATSEHWVFFARNSGHEGGCSRDEHFPTQRRAHPRDRNGAGLAGRGQRRRLADGCARLAQLWSGCGDADRALPGRRAPAGGRRRVRPVQNRLRRRNLEPAAARERSRAKDEARHDTAPLEEASIEPILALLSSTQREAYFAQLQQSTTADPTRRTYEAFEAAAGGPRAAVAILHRFENGARRS